jgi:hypothetical protein
VIFEFLKTDFLDFYLHSPADFRFFPLQFVDSSCCKLVTLLKFPGKVFITIGCVRLLVRIGPDRYQKHSFIGTVGIGPMRVVIVYSGTEPF